MLLMDGFENAFLGYAIRMSGDVAIYDHERMIKVLMLRDRMSAEEAIEFIEYNCQGAWCGEQTPLILYRLDKITDYDGSYDA